MIVAVSSLSAVAFALSIAAGVSGGGSVTYTTAKQGYLDVGSDDGLAVGAKVKVFRRRRQVATCEVVEVSATRGRCDSDKVVPGDHVVFVRAEAPAEEHKPDKKQQRDTPLTPGQMRSLRKAVEAAPLPHVKKKEGVVTDVLMSTRARATLKEQVWALSTTPDVFGRTSIDGGVRTHFTAGGFPLFASSAFRVVSDLVAPTAQRGRPGELVELYVWDAAVGVDDGGIVGEVGRFRPVMAPGVTLLDGAQVGARFLDTGEAGVYAGTIPDLITIAPSLDRITAGLYFGMNLAPLDGVVVIPRARAAVVATPDFAAARGELEAQAEMFWANVGSLGAEARVVTAADKLAASLDGVRFEAELTAFDPVHVSAGYRYLAAPAIDFDTLKVALNPENTAHHFNLDASYDLGPAVSLGVVSGAGYDVAADALRVYLGPQVELPKALGDFGGLSLGYLEELGFPAGRSAWVSAKLVPFPMLDVLVRTSYFENAALGDDYREAALMTILDAPVLPWLSLRGRAYLQQALPAADGTVRSAPSLLTADLGVTGTL